MQRLRARQLDKPHEQRVDKVRFSIIVPVYNVEAYLGECLDSIARQNYSDYEVVIIDDGSTDGSAAIYERFAAEAIVPVEIVRQENKGLLQARRAGIKAANGDYFWHVDGDDGLAPHAMDAVSGIIDELSPDVVLIGLSESSDFSSMLPGGLPGEQRFYVEESLNDVRSAFLEGFIPNMVAKIARRRCIDVDSDYSRYGRMQLGEDQLQSLYVLDNMKSVACIREPLYYYRPNASSITANYRGGQIAQYATVKEAVHLRALEWDAKYPGHQFAEAALAGYLSNGFYDMRKNVSVKWYRHQFQEFRDTSLYSSAIERINSLRFEQRLFFTLLDKRMDFLAYCCLVSCRAITPLARCLNR